MTAHLYFTFGPVQSFVAQARRTRLMLQCRGDA